MNEWWWTAAVAAVGIMAGYILCSLLVADRISRAQVTIRRVRDAAAGFVPVVTGNPQTDQMTRAQALQDADTVLRALDGPDD